MFTETAKFCLFKKRNSRGFKMMYSKMKLLNLQ